MIDEIASERVLKHYGVARCLQVPIAAVDEAAIGTYVGDIRQTLSGRGQRKAFLVHTHRAPEVDPNYPIWDHPAADILRQRLQVWVDIDYSCYRAAYRRAFPDEQLGQSVLSHAMNRRIAALKGFGFVRITPTSRSANSSSAMQEGWGVTLHGETLQMKINRSLGVSVEYADLTALMLMLDIKLGGGIMDAVNDGQKLIRPRG